MSTQSIPLFKAIGAKMDFLGERQRIISQNIANADTPGYRPQDLKPVDFGTMLKSFDGGESVSIRTTNPMHMPSAEAAINPQEGKQKTTYEVAPAGNAVIMEEQMVNSGQTVTDYNLMANLYQKNMRLMRIALGVQ